MAQFVKETITTPVNNVDPVVNSPSAVEPTNSQTAEYLIYFALGVLEILLAFRLILKLMGASTSSGFVKLIYSLSGIFVYPFEGIFSRWLSPGLETTSVFEPSTLVAIIVYAVLVWGLVKLLRVLSGRQQETD